MNHFGKAFLLLTAVIGIMLTGCESENQDELSPGQIVIQTFDAPFQGDVQHIYLNIIETSVHRTVSDSSSDTSAQWIVLSDVDTTIDFLELVNGEMATLVHENLEVGHYSQLRLMLGDSSSIVVNDAAYELKVPSGSQSRVKLDLGFSINSDEIISVYLDFDAERSINKHPNQDRYSLQPTFRVFKSVLSGTIAGTVADTAGNGLEDISVYAVANGDSVTTLTNADGQYKLILLADTYAVSAGGNGVAADTAYQNVALEAEENLAGYNFTME